MIRMHHVTRRYAGSGAAVDDVSVEIAPSEFVAITGPSGCGKSTLLHLIGGLDAVNAGELHVGGLALHGASERELTAYRRTQVGIVFQFFHLMPTMTVLENVSLPLLLRGDRLAAAEAAARRVVELVGLGDRSRHLPHQLSGGQMQRAAIARAVVHEPPILLADEPTGNLDSASAEQVLTLFQRIASLGRTTVILVTHSDEVARIASRRLHMRDGKIIHDQHP